MTVPSSPSSHSAIPHPPPPPPQTSNPTSMPRPFSSGNASGRPRSPSRASDESLPQPAASAIHKHTSVKVAVRIRPPLTETDPGYDLIPHRFRSSACEVTNQTTLTVQGKEKKLFIFDRVFDDAESQEAVWEYVSPGVEAFVQGYNVSILAYGQSGAGKSYTMGTASPLDLGSAADQGIVPRAAAVLFEKLGITKQPGSGIRPPSNYKTPQTPTSPAAKPDDKNWQLKATYVEIYNEQLRDLLIPDTVPQSERSSVTIREDTKGRIILTGLHQATINSVDDLMKALYFGSAIRQTDSTNINSQSSRSHAVFSLNLVQKKSRLDKRASTAADGNSESWVTIDSKLHFVDLAGSERLKNSGSTGERVREGISINAGLASLGKVISQLSQRAQGSHVSYRDSRLTRLLQDSLGGNAITYMIACVNPVEFHLSETLNTIQYAQRARAIQSRPQIQARSDEGDKQLIIDRLRSEIAFLRDQIRLQQHSERKNSSQERNGRQEERENELQNQLLDVQENYSKLSQRHAKLISELAKGKSDAELTSLPALKGALSNVSKDRLSRSSDLAEAVEQVVIEYEKTIQSLEQSLSNTRSSLATTEGSLLEREAKIVYLDAVTQQLQSRVQKAMTRETSGESYVRELEARLDGVSDGEEKHLAIIRDLRKELGRIRESESSAEHYISTLEERLAEAEQDMDIMQRQVNRLEQVVERQRSVGKLDHLLLELDQIRNDEIAPANGHAKAEEIDSQTDAFHDRLVATATARNLDDANSESAEEEWRNFGPMDGDEEEQANDFHDADEKPNGVQRTPAKAVAEEKVYTPSQAKALKDKMDVMVMELFDLRNERESTATELDEISRKYQIAISTLADLQDALNEARAPGQGSFLDRAGMHDLSARDGGSRSFSPVTSSDWPSRGVSPTLVEASDAGDSMPSDSGNGTFKNVREDTMTQAVRSMKRSIAEKDITINELTENYSQLQDQHKDTLNYIEELKEELQKAQTPLLAPPPTLSKRKSALSKDREARIYAVLENLAVENFPGQPHAAQTFQTHVEAAKTEAQLRHDRIAALESEVVATKKDLEVKNQMVTGLTKERSLRTSRQIDISMVKSMRDHLTESRRQITALQESTNSANMSLSEQLSSFKASLGKGQENVSPQLDGSNDADGVRSLDGSSEFVSASGSDRAISPKAGQMHEQLSKWEEQHAEAAASMHSVQQQLIQTIGGLEATLQGSENLQNEHGESTSRDVSSEHKAELEAEKARHMEQVNELQRQIVEHKAIADSHTQKLSHLEKSYTQIMKEVDEDAKSRQLTESELQTHRELVRNLEGQIDEQKSLAGFHQQGLKSLQDSHAKELDKLKAAMTAQQAASEKSLNEHIAKHQEATVALNDQLSKAQTQLQQIMQSTAIILPADTTSENIEERVKALALERKSLLEKHEAAAAALQAAQKEANSARAVSTDLEGKVQELTALNEETLRQLERTVEKERRSSRMLDEIQIKNSGSQKDLEKELEEHKTKIASLEAQLSENNKRNTVSTMRDSYADADGNSLRKSASQASLPSPPPAVPLPPLPPLKSPSRPETATSPPPSRHASKDIAHAQQQLIDEHESRIKTMEKHLYAEKQLTNTLEEALVELEGTNTQLKSEMDAWKKKCREVEEEASGLRRERGNMRNSVQAMEEEREKRLRAELSQRQLQQRMDDLARKKKKNSLNCF